MKYNVPHVAANNHAHFQILSLNLQLFRPAIEVAMLPIKLNNNICFNIYQKVSLHGMPCSHVHLSLHVFAIPPPTNF